MDETNVLDVVRTRLHMFGRWYPDDIDAHYTSFAQQAFAGNCISELMPPGEHEAWKAVLDCMYVAAYTWLAALCTCMCGIASNSRQHKVNLLQV
jgi:hypothetical protein